MDATERRNRASSEAADWFARLQAGEMERVERQQFVEWLRESHIHVTEMLRIAQIHGELKQFEHWARISTGPKTVDENIVQLPSTPNADPPRMTREEGCLRSGTSEGFRRPLLMFFAAAATVVLLVATAFVSQTIRGQVIETDRGERHQVVLSDGSLLQVDSETRLRVKYTGEIRQVFLEHGRALFHVAKSALRPFLVHAGGTTVRAVGTAFGVEEQTQGVVVTVAEGKVAVTSYSAPSTPLAQSERTVAEKRDGEGAVFLTADHQVMVPSSGSAALVREVDSHRALAWAEGRLIFNNDDLGKAVAEFNRYNRVQLIVADPTLAAKPVSGVFNAADPEAFIAFLQSVTAVQILRDGDRSITIYMVRRP